MKQNKLIGWTMGHKSPDTKKTWNEKKYCTQKTCAKFQVTDYDKLTEFWYATNDPSDISLAAILWIFCTLRNWSLG